MRLGRRLKSTRPSTVLLAALSVAATVAVPLALRDGLVQPASGIQSEVLGQSDFSTTPTASRPSALFIGDSYTTGKDSPDSSYACLTATNMGWHCNVVGEMGTGYISGGPGQRLSEESTSFSERFPRLRALYQADIVVLDGGRNDVRFEMAELRTSFEDTVRKAMESWPNSRIVVIAPWLIYQPVIRSPDLSGRTIGEELGAILRSSTDFDAVALIDPAALNWFAGIDTRPYTADDGVRPNVAGDSKIAELLTTGMIQHGLTNVA